MIVSCHRIIESNGELGGYGGGLSVKKRLLNLEIANTKLTDMVQQKNTTSIKGVWKLVSFKIELSNGEKIYPFGEKVKGLLIYTEKYMSGKLMSFDRPNFVIADPLKGTLTEIKKAFEEFIAYYGKYEIDEVKGIKALCRRKYVS